MASRSTSRIPGSVSAPPFSRPWAVRAAGRRLSFVVPLLVPLWASAGVDGYSLDTGPGAHNVGPGNGGSVLRVAFRWGWNRDWTLWRSWRLTGHWEASAGYLEAEKGRDATHELGATAVLRLTPAERLYLELGTGPHWVNDDRLDGTDLGSHFQFGSVAGVGTRFGDGGWEVGYRLWHLSNGNTASENPGLNYHLLHLGRRF